MYLLINIVFYCVIMDDFFCRKYDLDYKWSVYMYRLYGILVGVDLDVKKIVFL